MEYLFHQLPAHGMSVQLQQIFKLLYLFLKLLQQLFYHGHHLGTLEVVKSQDMQFLEMEEIQILQEL
jgi:hypothetical protein